MSHERVAVLIAACVKWVDLSPQIDPLHGTVEPRPHGAGLSESDLAAVETALLFAQAWDAEVVVATVGPPEADGALRELLAAGAHRAVRVHADGQHGPVEPTSPEVARLLVAAWGDARPDLVVCGDASVDRGSGAVPAYLAHELGAAQALGLIGVEPSGHGRLSALRRLDGARREQLSLEAPAVVSVEGSVATLRRAPLAATLEARGRPVEVHEVRLADEADEPRLHPWRPRPRVLPPPAGERPLDRIVALTGAHVERTPPRTLVLDPPEAAAAILAQLREWGYLADED